MNYVEKSLERELAAAKARLLAAAEAGPDAVRALATGAAGRRIDVDARTGEALSARIVLVTGGINVAYDTATAYLYGIAGGCARCVGLGDAAAAAVIGAAAWEPETEG